MPSSLRSSFCLLALGLLMAGALVPAAASAQELLPTQILFDDEDGVDGIGGPRQIVASPDGRFFYVAGEADSAIAVFERDPSSGELSFVQQVVQGVDADGIFGAASVAIPQDGRHLYATGAFGSSIAVFERNKQDGTLTFVEAEFNGQNGVSGLAATVWSAVSNDGKHVYAAGFADRSIVTFERDRQTGEITYVGKETGLPGVFAFELSDDGRHLYATALQASAIVAFERDRQTGLLTQVDFEIDGRNGVDGIRGARGIEVSHDGRSVYVAGLFDAAVAVFDRDPETGAVDFVQVLSTPQDGIVELINATDVAVSQNGKKVYVVGFGADGVAVFDRDPSTGLLTFAGGERDPFDGRTPLDGAISAEVAKNGQQLYVTGFRGEGIVVFDAEKN